MPDLFHNTRGLNSSMVSFDLPELSVETVAELKLPPHPTPQPPPALPVSGRATQVVETRCYFVPRELAKRWSVCVDKVLRFIQTGELRAFNVASPESRRPRYRISIEEVRRFEEQTRAAATPKAPVPPIPSRRRKHKSAAPTGRNYF